MIIVLLDQASGVTAVANNAVQEAEAEIKQYLVNFVVIYNIQAMGICRHRTE
ncbi:MAG: hypothetical protein U5L07_02760 [Desulfobacterales bacterium]|nr:hypothetical protein [Desulfobacterales bacterium]